ncbi:hypothetical protein EC988_008750 [Linderina pennispora]|nr:hypothetical protein EC988_008750 [Linderina pennispora]
MPAAKEQPKRVSTALRNFLEAAAEQIENQSLMPVTPEPDAKHVLPEVDAHAMKRQEPEPRPLPVPKSRPHNVRTGGNTQQPSYIPMPPMQQKPMAPSSPRSPLSPTAGQLRSNSVFSGSHESTYDADVVNALRQEAQRQINTSSSNMGLSSAKPPNVPRMLTPRGPSLADNLQKYGGRSGRVSVSSQFDPFVASQDLIHRGVQPTSPRAGAHPPMDFAPNKQLDNLERRFRNANFRPPWSVKPQSAFN